MQHAFLFVIFSLSRLALTPSQCSGRAVMLDGRPVQALLHCWVYNCMSIIVKLGKFDGACLARVESTYIAANREVGFSPTLMPSKTAAIMGDHHLTLMQSL